MQHQARHGLRLPVCRHGLALKLCLGGAPIPWARRLRQGSLLSFLSSMGTVPHRSLLITHRSLLITHRSFGTVRPDPVGTVE